MNEVMSAKLIKKIPIYFDANSLAFSPDEKSIAIGGIFSTNVLVFECLTGIELAKLSFSHSALMENTICWGNREKIILLHADSGNQTIGIWSESTLDKIRDIDCTITGGIRSMNVNSSGSVINVISEGSRADNLNIWMLNPETGIFSGENYKFNATHSAWLKDFLVVAGNMTEPKTGCGLLIIHPDKSVKPIKQFFDDKKQSRVTVVSHPNGMEGILSGVGWSENGFSFTTFWHFKLIESQVSIVSTYQVDAVSVVKCMFSNGSFLVESFDEGNSPLKIINPSDNTFIEIEIGTDRKPKGFTSSPSGKFISVGVSNEVLILEIGGVEDGDA